MDIRDTQPEDLVWRRAHQFVLAVYHYSEYFPQKEMHGLTAELRRAAIAIPASVLESRRHSVNRDRVQALDIGNSSIERCRYLLILARDLGYGEDPTLEPQLQALSRLLTNNRTA